MNNEYPKVTQLARTFPTFSTNGHKGDAPGLEPFDPETFDHWLKNTGCSHGERVTGKFLLSVFDPNQGWASGYFDLMEGLGVWDDAHRAAFIAWASAPWWP